MKTEFDILKGYYGDHSKAARALGITPRHYREIRNKKAGGTVIMNLIRITAQQIETTRVRDAA